MTDSIETGYERLAPESALCVDAACDRFEQAWRNGVRPKIDDFLHQAVDGERAILLRELVLLEIGLRRRGGERLRNDEYRERFPALEESWIARALVPSTREHGEMPTLGGVIAVPHSIPGFEILGELGRGGMGVVYKARDVHLNRTVALKTLFGGALSTPTQRDQFRREAEAIAHLDHPNIVPVYEVGEANGCPYFSMKFFAGGSLARRDRRPRDDFNKIARLVETTARAVHHAHQRGILHRDLKPSNILLDDEGGPHVADFGLAKRFDPQSGPSDVSTIAGTPGYMAPEQAISGRDLTTATDVYGLGAILYELLSGRPPFEGDSPLALLRQLVEDSPPRLASFRPNVPRDLETIAFKCLEKEPRRRYETAQELAEDLHRWQSGRPIRARPTPAWEYAWRWVVRHPVTAGLTALCAAALIALVAALSISNNRIRQSLAFEQQARNDLSAAMGREQQQLYFERIGSAHRLWLSNQTVRAEQLIDWCPHPLRNWEWHYLDRQRRMDCIKLSDRDVPVEGVAHSADGTLLATADRDGLIRLWNAETLKLIRSWPGRPFIMRMVFSPDGRHLLTAERSGTVESVRVWDVVSGLEFAQLRGGRWVDISRDGSRVATVSDLAVDIYEWPSRRLIHTLTGHTKAIWVAVFDNDGRRVVTTSLDLTVRFWDVATGQAVREPLVTPHHVSSVKFLPHGRILLAQQADALIIDEKTGRELDRFPPAVWGADRIALSADGQWLAWPLRDGTIKVWNTESREDEYSLRGHPPYIAGITFTRDKKQLITVGQDSTIRVWGFSRPTDYRTICRLRANGGLSFSRDGRRIAIALAGSGSHLGEENQVRIYDVDSSRELRQLNGLGSIAWGPNDRWLATHRNDGSISLWDPDSGKELRRLTAKGHRSLRFAMSPDQSLLAGGTVTGHVIVWNVNDGGDPIVADGHVGIVNSLAFSPDGQTLVTCDRDGNVCFRDRQGTVLRRWELKSSIQRVLVSPDNRYLLTAGGSTVATLWDIATGAELQKYHGHTSWVWGVAFNQAGDRLFTGGADETVRVWDVASGHELLQLPGPRGLVGHLALSPDGNSLMAADDAIRVWEIAESK